MSSEHSEIRERQILNRLSRDYDQLCFQYKLKLRKPVLRLEPVQSRLGHWDPEIRTLSLSDKMISDHPWAIVIEVLKHEMAHQMVSELFVETDSGAHGALFQKACEKLGVSPWARQASLDFAATVSEVLAEPAPEERLLKRVEKLLALAHSDNLNEAQAAMQKVQELYAKYNFEFRDRSDYTYLVIPLGKKRVERYQSMIASLLNDFFFVEVIHSTTFLAKQGQDSKAFELIGKKENLQIAEYVFHFLENQLRTLWNSSSSTHKGSLAAKNSYYLGVVSGFKEKLAANEKIIQRSHAQYEVAISESDPQLQSFLKTRYPRLSRKGFGRRQSVAGAFEAGKSHGRSLVLHKGVSEKKSFLGGFLTK